jgi:gas vesicle protein
MKSGKIIIGTVAGVTAGTILGLLLAPDKGSVTRKNISRKTSDFADTLRGKVDTYADTMNQKVDILKDKAIDWLERKKDRMRSPDVEANKGNNI